MKPSQTAANLRRIAAKLDASKNPDRRLVMSDLRRILAAVAGPQVYIFPFFHAVGDLTPIGIADPRYIEGQVEAFNQLANMAGKPPMEAMSPPGAHDWDGEQLELSVHIGYGDDSGFQNLTAATPEAMQKLTALKAQIGSILSSAKNEDGTPFPTSCDIITDPDSYGYVDLGPYS